VGGAAQPASLRTAARNLRIITSRFEALEALTRVGLDVDSATRKAVERGRILRELLRQPRFTVRTVADQIFALTALAEGWLDSLSPGDAASAVWSAAQRARTELPDVLAALEKAEALTDDWREHMRSLIPNVGEERH
jgi:F-type H+-transporting ATPase subunit alpha